MQQMSLLLYLGQLLTMDDKKHTSAKSTDEGVAWAVNHGYTDTTAFQTKERGKRDVP